MDVYTPFKKTSKKKEVSRAEKNSDSDMTFQTRDKTTQNSSYEEFLSKIFLHRFTKKMIKFSQWSMTILSLIERPPGRVQ